jgi:tetratricopeptide (TPR) repeat protein
MTEDHTRLEEIRAAVQVPDLVRAVALARLALAEGREHPLVLNLHAWWLEQQGRVQEALADLKRAHALAPDDAIVGNALGLCLARLGRLWDARQLFRETARNDPDFASAHFNHGWVAEELGLLSEARAALLRAEQLNPASASAPARLGYLAARTGDHETARRHAVRALAIDHNEPMAQLALATCEFEEARIDAAAARLRRLLADVCFGPFERALALGLLGDCLDQENRTGEAFSAYGACNGEFLKLYAPLWKTSAGSVAPYLSMLAAYFQSADGKAWRRNASIPPEMNPVAGHVFIVGFPRSGTTLLEEILGGHPLVCSTGERDGLDSAVREFMTDPGSLDRLAASDATQLLVFREKYWRKLRELGLELDGKVLVDKQPYSSVKLPLIAKLFPEANIIFISRDPRDVVFSCYRSRFTMNPSNYQLLTLEGSARLYASVLRLAEIFRTLLPLNVHDLRYDDLLEDFGGRSAALFRFIGLEGRDAVWGPRLRTQGRGIATPSAVQIARGLNRDGLGSWRRYASQLSPVLPLLQPWIDGYEARAVTNGH